ncbi:MAG: RNA polymerase factor sigma-54 [Pseudomonadota bacterium]
MKQTLQLRLGQQLTMTPQLQQAIKLLQLSSLDLRQEIQEILDSNLMLELDEEDESAPSLGEYLQEPPREDTSAPDHMASATGDDPPVAPEDRELNTTESTFDEPLPLDSDWTDVYDSPYPSGSSDSWEDDGDPLAQKSGVPTLWDHLSWQLAMDHFSESDRAIGVAIIDAVGEDGYLTGSLEDLQTSLTDWDVEDEEIAMMLRRVQQFDPPGVAARDLRECLMIQLRQKPPETPFCLEALKLCDHLPLLARKDHVLLKRRLKINDEVLQGAIALILTLDPKPGRRFGRRNSDYVVPDVLVSRRQGVWRVELNPESTPRLRVNPDYTRLVRRADSSDANTLLRNHLQEARWFLKSLSSRNDTILRVATRIVEFQRDFFEQGEEAMRPLVLRDIAEALEMHESTISRVTTQKFMYTPHGTFEFKYFFSSHVATSSGGECSATAIRALIKKLVAAEAPRSPLSDSNLADILVEQGIEVARRTVAKYREALGIPPSHERKRLA